MNRIAAYLVGVVWLIFTFMAFRAGAVGRAAGQADVAFWWTATALFLGVAAGVILIGTARHRYYGPRK